VRNADGKTLTAQEKVKGRKLFLIMQHTKETG
jgi:hypothetical protein